MIIKLGDPEYPGLVRNELACLEFARQCGLDVCGAEIQSDKDQNEVLLVQRFDRIWNESLGQYTKLHLQDACQFLDRYPADRYRLTLREIAQAIQDFAVSPKIEMLKLLEQYVFSYLIGNGDQHAKNISIVSDPSDDIYIVSPCYDLVCTFLYSDDSMALALDGRKKKFKRSHILKFANRIGLKDKETEQMLDRLIKNFDKSFDSFIEALRASQIRESKIKHCEVELRARLKALRATT